MMNDLFTIGPLTIHGYGLMMAIGILAAYLSVEYRSSRNGLDQEQIFPLGIWAVGGGLLGAKLLYYITELPAIIKNPSLLLNVTDGFVVYGGIIGGILGGYLFCRRRKLNFAGYFDLVMPSVALAQGFGRIGCFLAGCCYGMETDCPLGIVFQNSEFAPNGVRLVPTQLISSALDFMHFFVLILFARRFKKADGQVAGLYLVLYSIGRFILEFFRGDLIRGSVGRLSTSQFISIFILAVGIFILAVSPKLAGKKKETAENS